MSAPAPTTTPTDFCKFCGEEYSTARQKEGPKGTCSKECAQALIMFGESDVSYACLWCPRRGDMNVMKSRHLCKYCYRKRQGSNGVCCKCGAPGITRGRCAYCTNLNKDRSQHERIILLVDKSTRRASFRRVRTYGMKWELPVYYVDRGTFERAPTYGMIPSNEEGHPVFMTPRTETYVPESYDLVLKSFLLEWTHHYRGTGANVHEWQSRLDKVRKVLSLGTEFTARQWGPDTRTLERFCESMRRCGVRYDSKRGRRTRTLDLDDMRVIEIVLETAIRNHYEGAYWL